MQDDAFFQSFFIFLVLIARIRLWFLPLLPVYPAIQVLFFHRIMDSHTNILIIVAKASPIKYDAASVISAIFHCKPKTQIFSGLQFKIPQSDIRTFHSLKVRSPAVYHNHFLYP